MNLQRSDRTRYYLFCRSGMLWYIPMDLSHCLSAVKIYPLPGSGNGTG